MALFGFQWAFAHEVSDFSVEGPPVPIPNTEVKLYSGENTCLATDRENSSLLTYVAFDLDNVVAIAATCGSIASNTSPKKAHIEKGIYGNPVYPFHIPP